MSPPLIASDELGRPLAEQAAKLLTEAAVPAVLAIRERFPVADPMVAFLGKLNDQETRPLLVLSASSESAGWLLPELQQNPHLYSRIAVLFSNELVQDSKPLLTIAHVVEKDMNASNLLAMLSGRTRNE